MPKENKNGARIPRCYFSTMFCSTNHHISLDCHPQKSVSNTWQTTMLLTTLSHLYWPFHVLITWPDSDSIYLSANKNSAHWQSLYGSLSCADKLTTSNNSESPTFDWNNLLYIDEFSMLATFPLWGIWCYGWASSRLCLVLTGPISSISIPIISSTWAARHESFPKGRVHEEIYEPISRGVQ